MLDTIEQSQCFDDWFVNLMLPILKKQEGKKVVIRDNLSSHINLQVLQLCRENNINFIALPPNTTNLLQPLDVAYFQAIKAEWLTILNSWKECKCATIPKDQFPGLVKILLEN
jgi:hypothetical protein